MRRPPGVASTSSLRAGAPPSRGRTQASLRTKEEVIRLLFLYQTTDDILDVLIKLEVEEVKVLSYL